MTEFDELLLNPYYSAMARGGPSFSTIVTQTDTGISHRSVRRYDYIGKYTIDFKELEEAWREGLREFFILQWAQAYGFRFLAPDLNRLRDELLTDGHYNPATITAGVDPLALYIIKTYERLTRRYQRRIVKPAWDTVRIQIGDEFFEFATTETGAGGAPLYGQATYGAGVSGVTLDYTTGTLTFDPAARTQFAGQQVRVSCQFHLPVAFAVDDCEMGIDETTISEWTGLRLVELLPAELGILI